MLIYLSCVWVVGIFVGYKIDLPPWFCLLALLPLPWLFVARPYRKQLILVSLGIFLFVMAAVYAYGSLYSVDESKLRFYNDLGPAEIKGTVAADPDVRDRSTRLTLSVDAIFVDGAWREVDGKALVVVPRYPEYAYGDVLHLAGELETPSPIGDFDYRGYLAHQGIYTTLYYPHVDVLGEDQGFTPLAWIYALRGRLADTLAEVLPEPQAALAQGILLGLRGNIPADLNQDFVRSGMSHLLAISGFNVSIMAGIMLGVGLWLFGRKRYLYIWLALVAVWFYTVITGFNPPVVRAAVMASLFLIAEALGRQRSAAAALTLAAAVMVGINPYILGDASFQLSFMAMAGLIFIYPVLRDFGRGIVTSRLGDDGFFVSLADMMVDTMSAALAAIIAVWPLIAYYFGLFSLTGPLATFLATPLLTVIIAIGSLAALSGLVSLPVAQIIGWLAWPFLSLMILVAGGLGSPSLASVQVDWINPAFITGYYLALAAAVLLHAKRKRLRSLVAGTAGFMQGSVGLSPGLSRGIRWLMVALLLLAALVSYTAATLPGKDLRVSFLDVGQGDAILIRQGNRQILIDGGPSPQAITLELSRCLPFWDRTIDVVVLTHAHQDHLAGLVEVMRRYGVRQLIYPDFDYPSPQLDAMLALAGEKEVACTVARAGLQIELGDGVVIEVLSPGGEFITGTASDVDNNAAVLLLRDGDITFLFTADILSDTELELIYERAGLSGTVLKVAHHGSDSSTTPQFLAVVDPRAAVISVGADNTYGLPDDSVIALLGEKVGADNVYRTDEDGTITFTTDGKRLWVEVGD
ncbi:MAG: DNA internalization-related competence protein ComEC/Rec2 [Dehalococcoidales bacterium]